MTIPPSASGSESTATTHGYSRIPPIWLLLFATLLAALCLSAAIAWAIRVPWFGVQLAPDPNGIRVVAVSPQGPSDGLLAPGDVLRSLRTTDETIPLAGDLLVDWPFAQGTYAEYSRFLARNEKVFAIITNRPSRFVLSDGREVSITAVRKRPLSQIPTVFWTITGFGISAFLVGSGIWAFRRNQIAARLVAVNGAAYVLSCLCIGAYATREWLMEPDVLWWLSQGGQLGNLLYGFSAMALYWHYPRPLGRFPVARIALLSTGLLWLNQAFQVIEWPLQTFTLQYFPAFAVGGWFARRQWIATRRRPDERAALLWLMGPGLLSIGLVKTFYFLPQLLGTEHLIPYWGALLLSVGLYVGIVLGVLRYRLFELDRWWFAMWTWFLGGLSVVLVDIGLVYYANLNPVGALTLSLLLVGWVYFPVRQWMWGRLMRIPSERIETLLPVLLETFFASGNRPSPELWQGLLSRIFDPADARAVSGHLAGPRLEDDGLILAVPDIEGTRRVVLYGRHRGRSLFSPDDVNLAALILTLARKSAALREAQERGASVERERIARDLHDDVAPQLLTLTHSVADAKDAERARTALQTLRESIYALSAAPHELPIEAVIAEWRVEAADRAEAAGVELSWQQPQRIAGVLLNTRQRLNLARVLREAVSNALRHALPKTLCVAIEVDSTRLAVRLSHNGLITQPRTWHAGKGLNNMRTRIAELGGRVEWRLHPEHMTGLEVSWEIPLIPSSSPPK